MTDRAWLDIGLELDTLSSGMLDLDKNIIRRRMTLHDDRGRREQ